MSPDIILITLTLGSFAASFVNAGFATGGVYILLLSSVSVLPVTAAVPLQSAFAFSSLVARIAYFRAHIRWRLVATFVLGGTVGVLLGTRSFAALEDNILRLLMGFVLLALIWLPRLPHLPGLKHPFLFVGVAHAYIASIFGVGGVLQPAILRTDLSKAAITGTLAACLLLLDVMKIAGYLSLGFDYLAFLPHIALATLAGIAGTWAGKRVTHHISDQMFRRVFRLLVSLVALRLIWTGLSA
jgi:uncharacterized membrane protein YfcA